MLRTALGRHIAGALSDPKVIEIMVNPDGTLWLDRLGEGCASTGHHPLCRRRRADHPPDRRSRVRGSCQFPHRLGGAPDGRAF